MSLEREMETFRKILPELLQQGQKGKFVVIQGDVVAGVRDTLGEGERCGYDSFGLTQFLVKEITDEEKVYYFHRNIVPSPFSPRP